MIHIGSFLHVSEEEGDWWGREQQAPYAVREIGIYLGRYANDNVAVLLAQSLSGPPLANLSINVRPLPPGEFILNHDVDEKLLREVLTPRSELASLVVLFEDTGRRVTYGHIHGQGQPVWRVFDYEHRIHTVWKEE